MMKYVYSFGNLSDEISEYNPELLGNKGANLAKMSSLEIPVPPGFIITTEACKQYYKNNKQLPSEIYLQINDAIAKIEESLSLSFGASEKPLIVSVRSGAVVSMPGMMDTVLNLGLNDETVEALGKNSNNYRFAYDCYRRFIQMFACIVLGVDSDKFEHYLEQVKEELNIQEDSQIPASNLQQIITHFKEIVKSETGDEFPQDVRLQLKEAISAVFNSWMSNRAITYRKIHNFSEISGTAVNVQAMVFGNIDDNSGTGVLFTRNPSTGEKTLFGEYLINAQGEDVVAGIRTPYPVCSDISSDSSLENYMPEVYKDLASVAKNLEKFYKDMQDIEFTIQEGKLWILQTRSGKRSARAMVKIVCDLVEEGVLSKKEALLRIDTHSLDQLLHPAIDSQSKYEVITKGLPASPGAVTGHVYFDSETAEQMAKIHNVILVRKETSPEDIKGIHAAIGILTSRGGMTSHAAVVARGMGKTCVCGASNMQVDYLNKQFTTEKGIVVNQGDIITINGSAGEVILGAVETIVPDFNEDFINILEWAKEYKKLGVRANAEVQTEVKIAKKFGAEGIGLCRTEHMFFDEDRINIVRQMILSETTEQRAECLSKLLKIQISDFTEIFEVMEELPVNIRLLDPPLHEFLPRAEKDIIALAQEFGISYNNLLERINALHEHNPMLGHRGCRLGISLPEIYSMQVEAIFTAALTLGKKHTQKKYQIEIMVPFVLCPEELKIVKANIKAVADKILVGNSLEYQIGTMIELPRACIVAGKIAKEADFFSFGTNDLTQTTFGISRDDAASFMNNYIEKKIFAVDPFVEIDKEGVGELMKLVTENPEVKQKQIKTGVCGEHGGNPRSIEFFNELNLNYISCSAYRVPIAIIASAQAALKNK
jgi:pyruvate,orthophosphate dikinase